MNGQWTFKLAKQKQSPDLDYHPYDEATICDSSDNFVYKNKVLGSRSF